MRKITCPNCHAKMSPHTILNNPELFFCPFCFAHLDKAHKLISVSTGAHSLEDVLRQIDEEFRAGPKPEPPDYRP
jgi:transcription initiation factor IIE alpha subunit